MPKSLFDQYVSDLGSLYASGHATEHSYRPALQECLTRLLKDVQVTNEPKRQSYITRLISFSFMAPDLAARVLKGDIPVHVTRENLIYDWPISWVEQRRKFA